MDLYSSVWEEYADPANQTWMKPVVSILKLMVRKKLDRIAKVAPALFKPSATELGDLQRKRAWLLHAPVANYGREQLGQDIRGELCACVASVDHFSNLQRETNRE
jgi:hypothetical protein